MDKKKTDFEKMVEQFKEYGELFNYAEAQYKTIIELSKKINKIEEENNHLKELLEKNNGSLSVENENGFYKRKRNFYSCFYKN